MVSKHPSNAVKVRVEQFEVYAANKEEINGTNEEVEATHHDHEREFSQRKEAIVSNSK